MTKSELNALTCDLRSAVLKRHHVEDLIIEVWQVIDKMYEFYRDWPKENGQKIAGRKCPECDGTLHHFLDCKYGWDVVKTRNEFLGKNDPLKSNPNAPPFPE